MDIFEQISRGIIVCPQTKQKLSIQLETSTIMTFDRKYHYTLLYNKIPILLKDAHFIDKYVSDSKMAREYEQFPLEENSFIARLIRRLSSDYRSISSIKAFNDIFLNNNDKDDVIFLSIGGGPTRPCHKLINLNIGPFQNVDIVGDAHLLPYADNSVDAIYCEAVIEHLYNPVIAVYEMYRVLKKNGEAFVVTPFLQPYHGYPYHYQNYTLTGHETLFKSAGFKILESGTCVGPTYTIYSIVSSFLNNYLPSLASFPMRVLWFLLGLFFRPLDLILNKRENSYIMASTTYLVGKK